MLAGSSRPGASPVIGRRRSRDSSRDGRRCELALVRTRLHESAVFAPRAGRHDERLTACARVGLSQRNREWIRDEPHRCRRRDVHLHAAEPRRRARRRDRREEMGVRAPLHDHHRLLRTDQPRRRRLWRASLHGHRRRTTGGARRRVRQQAVGCAGRRERARLPHHGCAGCRRGTRDHRHQLRRAGRALLRERLRCRHRRAALALLHDPVAAGRRLVGIMEDDRCLRDESRSRHCARTQGQRGARRCVEKRRRADVARARDRHDAGARLSERRQSRA